MNAWIEYHILEEFSFNTDAFGASVYMTIDRGGKLTTGPVWDFEVMRMSTASTSIDSW